MMCARYFLQYQSCNLRHETGGINFDSFSDFFLSNSHSFSSYYFKLFLHLSWTTFCALTGGCYLFQQLAGTVYTETWTYIIHHESQML